MKEMKILDLPVSGCDMYDERKRTNGFIEFQKQQKEQFSYFEPKQTNPITTQNMFNFNSQPSSSVSIVEDDNDASIEWPSNALTYDVRPAEVKDVKGNCMPNFKIGAERNEERRPRPGTPINHVPS
jgi:hypothetical protein